MESTIPCILTRSPVPLEKKASQHQRSATILHGGRNYPLVITNKHDYTLHTDVPPFSFNVWNTVKTGQTNKQSTKQTNPKFTHSITNKYTYSIYKQKYSYLKPHYSVRLETSSEIGRA